MKLAVVGCGRWGMNYLRALNELGWLGIAVDTCAERREAVAEQYPELRVEDDISRLELQGVDGVIVATQPTDHVGTVAWLLNTGFPALCEKPLALNFRDTQTLAELAHSKRQILMVGHIMAYNVGFHDVCRLVSAGFVGKIRDISSTRLSLGRVRHPESVLWSSGVHDVHMILQLMDWDQPLLIKATGGAFYRSGVEDTVSVGMTFASGAVANVYASWLHPFRERRLTVVGERGTIIMDDIAKQVACYRADPILRNAELVSESGYYPAADEPLIAEIKAFARAIEHGDPLLSSAEVGVAVARVLQQAQDQLQPS